VQTDCQALVYLNLHKTVKPQVARWFEILQEFEFDIKYRPGTRMAHVYALSRAFAEDIGNERSVDAELTDRLDAFVAMSTADRVKFMQQADEQTRKWIQLLRDPDHLTRQERSEVHGFELENGLLYRICAGKPLLVVPKSMRKGVVIAAHDFGGHFSVDRTVARIAQDFWFAKMRRYVRQHINMCLNCLTHKKPAGKKPGLLHPIPPGKRPLIIDINR